MEGSEKMSGGSQEEATTETSHSNPVPSKVENLPEETVDQVNTSPGLEDQVQTLTDPDDKVSSKTGEKPSDKDTVTPENNGSSQSSEQEQRSSPPNQMDSSKLDSPTVRTDCPTEGDQDGTTVEEGEVEHEGSASPERTEKSLDNSSPVVEDVGNNGRIRWTVRLNVEADVANNASIQRNDASQTQLNSSNQAALEEGVIEHSNSTSLPVAVPASDPTEAEQENGTAQGVDEKCPPVSIPTPELDRRISVSEVVKETSNSVTPSKPGTPETGISVNTKGDLGLQSRLTTPHPPSRTHPDRPQTEASGSTEFTYDEKKDFRTPDYEYAQTPLFSVRGDSALRQERRTVSRGDSTKSVTFADDLMGRKSAKDYEVEEGDEEAGDSTRDAGDDETRMPEAGKGETASTVEGETAADGAGEELPEEKESAETAAADLFPTAVSEEKIEEAKQRRKERAASDAALKEQRLVGLFGAPRLEEKHSMEDVVGSRAREHFDKGCVCLSELQYGQAVVCFDKAINLCSKEVRYYLMRGEAYLQLCDFQSAILNFKKACVLAPDNDAYYSRLAFVYYFQGQTLFDQCLFAEALESFSRASEMRPEIVGYHTRSVACLAALQRHGECLALVNKRLEVEQNNPDLYIMRARLHELFRNTSLCYYDLKDAIALDPGQAEASALMRQLEARAEENRNHAVRLQLQGKLKEAVHKITEAVETNPAVADYHLLRGALHRRLHDYNAAIDDFLLALDKTDHNEQSRVYLEAQRQLLLTYNDFAVECFLGGHFEEAIILLNKAIKGEKREKGLYINRLDCFFRLNELHFALADYHQALELDNGDWTIRSRIASIHSEFGLLDYEEHSYKEAEARFTVAIQHNPRVGSFYIYRAKVRYMLENHPGARHDLLVTLHLEPNNEEILSLLPRLFPGKTIAEIMRSKAGRQAKAEVENAVVTASPVRLPALTGDAASRGEQLSSPPQAKAPAGAAAKQVAFAPAAATPRDSVMPDLKACMDEIGFNTVLAKKKKKISSHVKSLLHDRQSLWTDAPKLCPQPPARPYEVRGGNPNKNQSNIDPAMGWRSFSVGVGLK
ncbi:uncharacterized protein LOC110976332 [Acanthaster planci]|uniref:Uncharacterized protein LOC110976332 n=1 Tax=Acanthaster planci TaxID=133434 RepID=A0A8B7XYU9_ACAPL|nr:uncharacterized protein LOC110976332 [Acanthaster planci]